MTTKVTYCKHKEIVHCILDIAMITAFYVLQQLFLCRRNIYLKNRVHQCSPLPVWVIVSP